MSRQLHQPRGMGSEGHGQPEACADEPVDNYPAVTFESATDEDAFADSLISPSTFQPLFALVTNSGEAEVHHPSVYYVFSDDAENERDGHDVATFAALTALNDANSAEADATADLDPEERFILVDLQPSNDPLGVQIQSLASTSPSWAITSASLRQAPTLGDEDTQDTSVMLRIEGIDVASASAAARLQGNDQDESHVGSAAFKLARRRINGNAMEGMGELARQLENSFSISDRTSDPLGQRERPA